MDLRKQLEKMLVHTGQTNNNQKENAPFQKLSIAFDTQLQDFRSLSKANKKNAWICKTRLLLYW
jgi:hypothetical protein